MQGEEPRAAELRKTPSGIRGLDEITEGGLPQGRPILVCGTPGCGKTLLGIEFLVHGAQEYGEPGVLLSFEETADDLAKNVASLGFDLERLVAEKKLVIDHIRVERSEIQETGEYDLEGLFVRLAYAIDSIHAKRVVLDTIETLFGGLSNEGILRAELRRLFAWLKQKGVTTIITGERGTATITRQGLEEYVSDCVILLDHRVTNQVSTRRLRIVKYRGSAHEANEFPFIIDREGLIILPITSARLAHKASGERISTGIPGLDDMLGGAGYFRGSTVLLSGTAGTGKTSVAARFAEAAARRGERTLYFAFEESREQLTRNMRSIAIDLASCPADNLQFHCDRPTLLGLEAHLSSMIHRIERFRPGVVVVDPISSLLTANAPPEVQAMLIRLIDYLKHRGITTLLTSLADVMSPANATEIGISSIVDTWLVLRDIESERQRTHGLHVIKSRGMKHSKEVGSFTLADDGIHVGSTRGARGKSGKAPSAPREGNSGG